MWKSILVVLLCVLVAVGSHSHHTGCSIRKRQQVVEVQEEGGAAMVCFSSRRQPSCSAECERVEGVEEEVDFRCIPSNERTQVLADLVRDGEIPRGIHVHKPNVFKSIAVNIPSGCRVRGEPPLSLQTTKPEV